jgi:hypothetical protein
MHSQEQKIGPKIFNSNESLSFYKDNSFVIPEGVTLREMDIQCIDDRVPNKKSSNTIGIPGAAVGIPMAIFGTIYDIEKNHKKQAPVGYQMIMQANENVVGTVSYHTDEAEKEKNNPLCCAGCGYMNGALSNPNFGLAPDMSEYLTGTYLPELSKKVKPHVYPGKHWASAVFVIDDPNIGVQTHDEHGNQIYRLNRYWYSQALSEIIESTYPMIHTAFPDVSLEVYKEKVGETALMQIKAALAHLWPNKSVMVFKDGQVSEVML